MREAPVIKEKMEEQVCEALIKEVDEREEAVAAAVAVVGASARRGVVTLCASVAHIIRKNLRLQQQVKELEERLKALERLTSEDSAASQCQECVSAISAMSAASQSTSDSLPESPSSQRCGSAPPHFLAGSLRPCGGPGVAPRKASDPGSGATFLRGHTRASTGNLNPCGPPLAPFVRRKYSSISLRRVRRHSPPAGRTGRAATVGIEGSNTSLEQHTTTSTTSSKSCIVTVAEVYPLPTTATTTTTTTTTNNNNNNNKESDAVKLLAQKLTSVLQEGTTHHQHHHQHHQHQQEEFEDMVVCAPHPLAGCECVVCVQLSADPENVPYEVVTDEGSLLPPGSTVLVRGRRVGTVVYFGHCKNQVRGSDGPAAPLLPPMPPDTQGSPGEGCEGGLASPLGVTLQLWPPDEGEVFVPLNDIICQLDGDGDTNTNSNTSDTPLDTTTITTDTELDDTLTDTHTHSDTYEEVCGHTNDTAPTGHMERSIEDTRHTRSQQFANVSDISMYESFGTRRGMKDTSRRPAGYQEPQMKVLHGHIDGTGSDTQCQECVGGEKCHRSDQEWHRSHGTLGHHSQAPGRHSKDLNCDLQSDNLHFGDLGSLDGDHGDRKVQYGDLGNQEGGRKFEFGNHGDKKLQYGDLERQNGDKRLQYSDVETQNGDKKLQFGDTWDSGCYVNFGRHGSECSEFSDPESDYGNAGHPWSTSLEEALNSVWRKHKHGDALPLYLRTSPDTFILDSEIELKDYSGCEKVREDTVC